MEKGNLSISRVEDGSKRWISLTVEDEISGIVFLKVEISLENMMMALTNVGDCDCKFELRGLVNVGKRYEHKTEMIKISNPFYLSEEEIDKIIQPYEIEGWIARKNDIKNHHNYLSDGTVKVHFGRFVERK